jgi:diaminohydroxyphosphoribosylaminopyrimidine deaminase/5-amino-6-(5-phosphoribosylamino)uracil reductase
VIPDDARHMARALELAARATGRTSPNPMVGCVITRDGAVLSEGWHTGPGRLHAEREALAPLDGRADGATAYVSLEPCCHHGRTPPCTDALLASGVARVVVAMVDPDPRVAGQGIEILRRAGIQVEVGVMEAEARALNAGFVTSVTKGRPMVVLKAGVTLDGRIADAAGRSQWITGPAARARGHALRHRADGILVGAGTLLADDPALNTRLDGGTDAVPVLLDTSLRVPGDARVLTAGKRPVVFCAEDAPDRDLPADVVRVPRGGGGLDLAAVLATLQARGMRSVLVEGGGHVHRSLFAAGLVDRVHLFLAPLALAGGPGWVAGPGFPLADAPRLRVVSVTMAGEDVELVLEPASA